MSPPFFRSNLSTWYEWHRTKTAATSGTATTHAALTLSVRPAYPYLVSVPFLNLSSRPIPDKIQTFSRNRESEDSTPTGGWSPSGRKSDR